MHVKPAGVVYLVLWDLLASVAELAKSYKTHM